MAKDEAWGQADMPQSKLVDKTEPEMALDCETVYRCSFL